MWLDELCLHMTSYKRAALKGSWIDKEKCRVEALQYSTKQEFHKQNRVAFFVSCKNNWIDEICSHMEGTEKGENVRANNSE